MPARSSASPRPRVLTLLPVNQLCTPRTNRVKPHTKLGSTLTTHAHNPSEPVVNDGTQTAGRETAFFAESHSEFCDPRRPPAPAEVTSPTHSTCQTPRNRLIDSFIRGIWQVRLNADSQLRRRNTIGPRCNHSGSPAGSDIARHSVFWSSPTIPEGDPPRSTPGKNNPVSSRGATGPQETPNDSRRGVSGPGTFSNSGRDNFDL